MTASKLIIILLFFLAGKAFADHTTIKGPAEWTNADTAWQTVFLTLLYVDYKQAASVVDNPKYIETNPLLGESPSLPRLRNYSIGIAIGHTVLAYILPKDGRDAIQFLGITVEAIVVYHNHNEGIRINFSKIF